METIALTIGTYTAGNGIQQDNTRKVEFEGERLAVRTEYGVDSYANLSDTRGVTETLYRTADGRHVVHVEEWSRWQGEPSIYTLYPCEPEDLGVGGRFEMLGHEAGLGRPLTIDEALQSA